jgi:tRNA(Ile)-lysidine synthase
VITRFCRTVRETIQEQAMLAHGQRVLVGVSGGPDSVALLLVLLRLRSGMDIFLKIVHFNHRLRGAESDQDEAFVHELAARLGLDCHSGGADTKDYAKHKRLSMEEAARDLRYSFFKSIKEMYGCDRIALGHTMDDNAELVLMNLLRGSGPKGLSGIPPVRDGWIVRPLIQVDRKEILAYLDAEKQSYRIDASNMDPSYLRNRVRHDLMPGLQKTYNPNITQTLNRVSQIIRDEDLWMDNEALKAFTQAKIHQSKDEIGLSLDFLSMLAPALVRRVIRKAIETVKGNLRRITLLHIDAAVGLAFSTGPGVYLDLPDRIRVVRRVDRICFKKESQPLREIKPD